MKLTSLLNENNYDAETGLPPNLEIGDRITNGPAAPVFVVRGKEVENGTTVYTAFSERAYPAYRGDEDGEYIDLKFTVQNGKMVPLPEYKHVL